jgi:hypothetical protein
VRLALRRPLDQPKKNFMAGRSAGERKSLPPYRSKPLEFFPPTKKRPANGEFGTFFEVKREVKGISR